MYKYFTMAANGTRITITRKNKNMRVHHISIFMDQYHMGSMFLTDKIVFYTNGYQPGSIHIQAEVIINGKLARLNETHFVKLNNFRETQYKPGDILVACDNVNGLPYGYMGHAAIVINDKEAIESVPLNPIVRMITIDSFKEAHPIHAQFRPVSEEKGRKAAAYALNYLNIYQENKKKGLNKPKFKFTIKTPLQDEWTYIYCTKLIWLSYYYGAGIEFTNDHLWFSPEDLYTNCLDNPEFELIYIHPDFEFYIDL